jgi:hypothetical protein
MGGAAKKKKARPARPPAAVEQQLVSLYALLTACGFAGILAAHAHSHHYHDPCAHSAAAASRSWWHHSANLTPAQAAEADRLERAMLWCSAFQAVAAALALPLPQLRAGVGGGSRRVALLAPWAALAAAAANHCMYARLHLLFVAADPGPGDTLYRVVGAAGVLGYAACDLLAFRALLLGRGV